MEKTTSYTALIRHRASELGFNDCGFARAEKPEEDASIFHHWLSEGMHSGMKWMENHSEKRTDPRLLVPGAKTVVSVLLNYYNPTMQDDPEAPVLSRYAYGRDYHKIIRKKLKLLLDYIREIMPGTGGRAFADSAPVLEHAWAVRSGLGWIGKNSLLLSKKYGSYVFLGELIIDADLAPDEIQVTDHCGQCRLCVDECPTHAINPDRTVNAGKCISYFTIEHKGEIPSGLKDSFYNRVFGCDICQDVCPWNRRLEPHQIPDLNPREEVMGMKRKDWYEMDEEKFNEFFAGTPVKRAKYEGIRRNLEFLRQD